jgi:hypothetical protein
MPVKQRRATLSGANLMIFTGQITKTDLLQQFGAIDESDSASSVNWLIVDIGYADVSDLDFATLLRLKAILGPKMVVMKARRPFDVAIVCRRPFNAPIYLTWQSLVGDDEAYPSNPMLFSDLGAACRRLGYDGPEYAELHDMCTDQR